VANRTASDIYATLIAAGFSKSAAVTMTAISLAESGGNPTARGDLGLQTATWGPSYGLFQVRTLKAETGKGTDRDINALATSDLRQAQAAYAISGKGITFGPWSTYTSGSYRKFLAQAEAAAKGGGTVLDGGTGTGVATSGGVAGWMTGVTSKMRDLTIEGVFVILGVGLVGVGIARSVGVGAKLKKAVGVVV
jgi:hypothetical protein